MMTTSITGASSNSAARSPMRGTRASTRYDAETEAGNEDQREVEKSGAQRADERSLCDQKTVPRRARQRARTG
jgi:hypothetical protein